MINEYAYLVTEDYLLETEIINPECPDTGIKLTKFLWKQAGVTGPRVGYKLLGPVVFNNDPDNSNDCLTRTLEVALQKMQLKFDAKVITNRAKAEDLLKEAEKYSIDVRKLVLEQESYTSPFTGKSI